MTTEEIAMLSYLQQKHKQSFNTPSVLQPPTIAPKPKKRHKKKIVKKSDGKLGLYIFCFIVLLITVRFLYNEFTKEPPRQVKVSYSKRK